MYTVIERYEALKEKVIERRVDFYNLIAFIETETAWLTAPASTRFHLSQEQGLLEHSCNVAETMLKIKDSIAPMIPKEGHCSRPQENLTLICANLRGEARGFLLGKNFTGTATPG